MFKKPEGSDSSPEPNRYSGVAYTGADGVLKVAGMDHIGEDFLPTLKVPVLFLHLFDSALHLNAMTMALLTSHGVHYVGDLVQLSYEQTQELLQSSPINMQALQEISDVRVKMNMPFGRKLSDGLKKSWDMERSTMSGEVCGIIEGTRREVEES